MTPRKQSADIVVYQLKVTLMGSKPPIWRRIQVTSDTALDKLHRIIQVVMGWDGDHLHQFIIGGNYYGEPSADWGFGVRDESKVRLSRVVSGIKTKFVYEYDFGDDWLHQILVEKILPLEEGAPYPVCVTGKRACPPEDCGGIGGYYDFVEAIQNPDQPEHKNMLEWFGGRFDPEAFDLEAINMGLKESWLA